MRASTGPDRDAEVIRRGVRAGLVVWAAVGVLLIGVSAATGAGGRAGATGAVLGFALGTLTTAAWLLLAGILDLLADHHPRRTRVMWTVGAVLLAFLAPAMVLGAAGITPP